MHRSMHTSRARKPLRASATVRTLVTATNGAVEPASATLRTKQTARRGGCTATRAGVAAADNTGAALVPLVRWTFADSTNFGGLLMHIAVHGESPTRAAPSARLAVPPAADLRCKQHGFVMTVKPSVALPSGGDGGRLEVGVAQTHPTGTCGTAAYLS